MNHRGKGCECTGPNIVWYNELFDARYCPECRVWLESKCSDNDCEYCSTRPDVPPMLKEDRNGSYWKFEDGTQIPTNEHD